VDFKVLQKKIGIAENTLGRISKIVKALGSFSRNASLDPKEPIKVSTIIEETLSLCQERIRSRTVDLRLDINRDNTVMGRPGQISQVILNLLNNSFDALEHDPAPWIELKTRTKGNLEVVTVTDSGKGIPKQVRDKIMQPFFTTKEVGKGTGLGLSISKGIIEDHGGRFYYDDQSENTRFVIELPILKPVIS
jgi:C4-dicarboxylate-specific signal transduction histidine kinase